ncbi:MAG: Glu-tRNA(Gln) amidotransferase subunit GatE [Ignavibacteriales bacterium]|nr:Glu-tRNA(Gln) amidotransferase subunit GatE [Ignavibacteriales bacterium]
MYDFIFKPFNEMTEADYERVGFKSGLEIHQQLLTDKKLFCRCPARIYSDKYDAEILRHMRPTLSELGEYDGTALMEFKTKKNIIYRINRETVCTYEMDDTPPFLINEEALDIGIAVGLMFKCKIVDEIHIARKQYLDGSIPTGFQRTSIIALDGKIPYKNREINVVQISIEEDACREVSDIGHERIYKTDRLGMPLVETVTAPEMKTPVEVAEVAQICRFNVRTTGLVRTGIGAAREDVNVSVTGGTRIEIKGVSQIKNIPLLTYNEAMRQWNLLRLREELLKRGITTDTFKATKHDITKLLKNPHYQPIVNAIQNGLKIKCVVLKGFYDLLHWQTQTDTYFSKEISDRVRVIACLTSIPNIIHSDSKGETLTSSEWHSIKKVVNATDDDTVVIVWGDERDSTTAVEEIIIRAREATIGIPSETRQALRDGTNGFERILPGPQRMYPDTDLPPKNIPQERVNKIQSDLPKPLWALEKYYRSIGVPEDCIIPLAISNSKKLFELTVNDWKLEPKLVSVVLVQFRKRLKREGVNVDFLDENIMQQILKLLKDKKILKSAILPLMRKFRETKNIECYKEFTPLSDEEIDRIIDKAFIEIKNIKIFKPENYHNVLASLVMKNAVGRIEAGKLIELINKKIEK